MSRKPTLPYINYSAVKAATTIEMVLDHYGIASTLKAHGTDSLRGCCPIHEGTDDTQFAVTPAKNLWRCFSANGCYPGGNHLDLVMRLEDCTLHEAAWKMNEWFVLGQEKKMQEKPSPPKARRAAQEKTPTSNSKTPVESPPPTTDPRNPTHEEAGENKVLSFSLQNLDPTHPYLLERGLTPEAIAEFGLGFCPKGILAGRIAIPIHNRSGELVANAGRWPGDPPADKEKYRLPGGFKPSLELFNAHRAFAESVELPLIIVQSYFHVFRLWQKGFPRVVSFLGSGLSSRQEETIRVNVSHADRIIVLLGQPEGGNFLRREIASRLADNCYVRSLPYAEDIKSSALL